MSIKLTTIKDVSDFINLISTKEGAATVSQGRYIVNAHSLMGIFSLDLMRPIQLELESGNYSAFQRFAA